MRPSKSVSLRSLRVWVLGLLTCVQGPAIHWRRPPEGNRGRAGISISRRSCNDDTLSGKMLVECYLSEDSCMRDEERREKGRRRGSGILRSTYGGRLRRWWPEPLPTRSTLPRHLRPHGHRCRGRRTRICTLLVAGLGRSEARAAEVDVVKRREAAICT